MSSILDLARIEHARAANLIDKLPQFLYTIRAVFYPKLGNFTLPQVWG
jgi:hypothetical protein